MRIMEYSLNCYLHKCKWIPLCFVKRRPTVWLCGKCISSWESWRLTQLIKDLGEDSGCKISNIQTGFKNKEADTT